MPYLDWYADAIMEVEGDVEKVCRRHEVVFDWKVEDFSLLPDKIGYSCFSPDFDFCGVSWHLQLFPNGEDEESEGFVGLYLCSPYRGPPVEVLFSLGIRTSTGETQTEVADTLGESGHFSALVRGGERSELFRRRGEMLPLDVLTVRATLKEPLPLEELDPSEAAGSSSDSSSLWTDILSEDKCTQTSPGIPPDLESLSRDFRRLLELEVFPDMKLRCGDRNFFAHRCILAARCQSFTATLLNKMAESETGTVDITDTDSEVLDVLLQYVYSGKISDLRDDTVSSLYAAGDKYSIHALKRTCSDWMVRSLTLENCLRFLKLAEVHGDEDFKESVVDFVAENLESIKRDAWSGFDKDHAGLALSVYKRRLESALSKQA